MTLKTILLPLLFPVALLGAISAIVWFVFAAGWHTASDWVDDQIEELP